jgi:hypothetical protein
VAPTHGQNPAPLSQNKPNKRAEENHVQKRNVVSIHVLNVVAKGWKAARMLVSAGDTVAERQYAVRWHGMKTRCRKLTRCEFLARWLLISPAGDFPAGKSLEGPFQIE